MFTISVTTRYHLFSVWLLNSVEMESYFKRSKPKFSCAWIHCNLCCNPELASYVHFGHKNHMHNFVLMIVFCSPVTGPIPSTMTLVTRRYQNYQVWHPKVVCMICLSKLAYNLCGALFMSGTQCLFKRQIQVQNEHDRCSIYKRQGEDIFL